MPVADHPSTPRETPVPVADHPEHPEHAKLAAVRDRSQACGEFYEWLQGQGYVLAEYANPCSDAPTLVTRRLDDLLADFFDIDRVGLEREKRAMLEEIRRANDEGGPSCG